MSEKNPYTATIVSIEGTPSAYIDIRPPITPSERLLADCARFTAVDVTHYLSSAQVTRLEATPIINYPVHEVKVNALREAGNFIINEVWAAEQSLMHQPGRNGQNFIDPNASN